MELQTFGSNGDFDDEIFLRNRKNKEKPPLWDSFQDPPSKKATGSAATWNKLSFLLKLFKLFTYLFVFVIVLGTAVVSKVTYLLMIAQVTKGTIVKYCHIVEPKSTMWVQLPNEEKIAWLWGIIFAFAAPEVFTFLRALRICTFKDVKSPSWLEVVLVVLFELLHVVGLAVFTFVVLPELDSGKALMLCNCVSFLPALLNIFSGLHLDCRSVIFVVVSALALISQLSAFVVWPVMTNSFSVQILAIPLILISFRWWENFVNCFWNIAYLTRTIRRTKSRYQTYLYLAPLKIVLFVIMAFSMDGRVFSDYFTKFSSGWRTHDIIVQKNASNTTSFSMSEAFRIKSSPSALIYVLLVQIFSSYLCFIFSKFACKIKIQHFSFALPLSLVGPASVCITILLAGLRESDVCIFHGFIPDYFALKPIDLQHITEYIVKDGLWIWIFWWLSQLWITSHVWHPRNDKNAPTEKLFVCPWYCSLLVDQCIVMNRRIVDWNDDYLSMKNDISVVISGEKISDISETDKIPQLIICATMWHETQEEMMEFLKSIVRLDEDQCARRMAKIHINDGKPDDEYYELERKMAGFRTIYQPLTCHVLQKRYNRRIKQRNINKFCIFCCSVAVIIKANIFFDDAFVLDDALCENPKNPPLNEYVKLLITHIEKAAFEVYGVNMKIKPPVKIETPYGGRLVWTLPGRSKMIAHLKNKDKIRHKKRWSQVMYMYYLLGFRIMELDDVPASRKAIIADNTFLLALDGDIDFQPQAVQLLIDRMKAIDELGAACGRIHPVGRGPMVWYQIFEYAIGHWLQKATEHVIGCVLCSPGCFSLFRGSALMENSVMKKYTTVSQEPMHYVQYDQGEDRWLCTLILKQGLRVEYSAASDAYTHAPEVFNEFYNQRRRWVPSTIANIFDLLSDAEMVVKNNSSVSMPYVAYQGMLMVGTILGPGTIFLMMMGALVTVFGIGIWTAFLWNFFPVLLFMLSCIYMKQKYQLLFAFVISSMYCLVMMAVLIGIIIQMIDDGPLAPASLFFLLVFSQIFIAGVVHPQEMGALICGFIYYITIPSMYMLLLIYSVFNMNDVSWGTREAAPKKDEDNVSSAEVENGREYLPGWMNDPLLVDSELGEISLREKRFWKDLIKLYLKPLFHTKEKKAEIADSLTELRNIFAFAFVMTNAIFVLIVFLLQLKKEYLHLEWPIDPLDFITYDDTNSQIYIYRQYKELDPIGLCFVVFFGLILIIQFIAMFFHRFATVSQLLATTQLDWFRTTSALTDEDAAQEIRGNAVNIARQLQRPKRFDDDDDDAATHANENFNVDNDEGTVRRQTIFKLHENRNKQQQDYSDLPRNFERRFLSDDDIQVKNISMSRKSLMMLNETRFVAKRRLTEQVRRNTDFNKNPTFAYENSGFEPSIEW